jgi:hypothetical protein
VRHTVVLEIKFPLCDAINEDLMAAVAELEAE